MGRSLCAAQEYLGGIYQEPSFLKDIRERAAKTDVPINVSPDEARFLQFLIVAHEVKTIVEIGTHFGYSALSMATALPANGQLYTCEKDPKRAAVAREHFAQHKDGAKIQLLEGDALESLSKQALPFIDMVFIDANKSGYTDYYEWAVTHVRPGGIIVLDNTFLMGTVYGETLPPHIKPKLVSKMQALNEHIANDSRVYACTLATQEGLTIAIKN